MELRPRTKAETEHHKSKHKSKHNCMNETFLLEGQEINVHGYNWFGNNRKHAAKRASTGSGRVGMLIKTSILENFDVHVAVIEDKFEGTLWTQLIHKSRKRTLGISMMSSTGTTFGLSGRLGVVSFLGPCPELLLG